MTKSPYLKRLDERTSRAELKQQIVFGLVIGWLLTLLGSFNYFLVPGAKDALWYAALWVGLIILMVTLVIPTLLSPLERLWMQLAHLIGQATFSTILTVAYFLFFLPVGLFLRKRRGCHPFYSWGSGSQVEPEGWVKKVLPVEALPTGDRRRPLFTQPFLVAGYFLRNGHYLFLPALVFLLLLGLILFFVQSSALAPFIYTLF